MPSSFRNDTHSTDCFWSCEVSSWWSVLTALQHPIRNVNKAIFWLLFLDMKSEKKLDGFSRPSVRESIRETRERVSSYLWWHPYVCVMEGKIIVSQYLSNCLHLLGDESWHHFLSARAHFGFVPLRYKLCVFVACACRCAGCFQCHSFWADFDKTQAL